MSPRLIKLPPTLLYALERLEDFVDKPYKFGSITCNRPRKPRLMRRERRENVRKVLLALVLRMDLVSGRILRPLGPDKGVEVYADCSLNWLVRASGVSRRTLYRVIVDLESVGWLKRDKRVIRDGLEEGTILVATVVRWLTQRFFEALGLVKDWLRDKEHLEGSRRARMVKALFRVARTNAKRAIGRFTTAAGDIPPPRMDQAAKYPGRTQADLQACLAQQLRAANGAWYARLNPKAKEIMLDLMPDSDGRP